ncbi:MAG: adenosine deaminase, partial [Flavobacteriaceae bacterium]|nr:adenosine deaminase [Flavobacteriaceae bacterium]
KDLQEHPLKKMMDKGLKVTVNSDDPAYFGGQVNKNYEEIQMALGLTEHDLYTLAKNSFKYSLLSETEKQQHLAELDSYFARHN